MVNESLLKKLSYLGLPLFQTEDYFDANETLADVIRSHSVRLYESFPLLLANAYKKEEFDREAVTSLLNKASENLLFKKLVLMSVAFYRYLNIKFDWTNELYDGFQDPDKDMTTHFLNEFDVKKNVVVGRFELSLERMNQTFNNYFQELGSEVRNLKEERENLSFEQALSHVFSPKQKELFLKKFKGEKMTKTEKEYFSRAVKKKVLSLANSELHALAKEMLSKF